MSPAQTTSTTRPASAPPLRVRTRNDYNVPFLVDCGQRNAVFVKRRWTPLHRIFRWADAFAILPEPDFDIVHAVNAVPVLNRRPYVLTFEDYLPRVPEDRYVGWLQALMQRQLLSSRCVALVAVSQFALRQFRWQNRGFSGLAELEGKIEQLYPSIELRRHEPKQLSNSTLRLAFVGSDFMRKGGPAVLRAHQRLREHGVPVQTTIVSSLRWHANDYIGPPSAEYVARELACLRQPGITHHAWLDNARVLQVMDEAHLLLFPTLHDTFGYVSLEAMAGGTPALASATCAQPEIIEDGVCGYLLPLENERNVGKWVWTYRQHEPGYLDAYERAIAELADAIAQRTLACWEDPGGYAALSEGAIERVRARFARDTMRPRLELLYERCRARLPRRLSAPRVGRPRPSRPSR